MGTAVSFILLEEGKVRLKFREGGLVVSLRCFQCKKQSGGEWQALVCIASEPCPI